MTRLRTTTLVFASLVCAFASAAPAAPSATSVVIRGKTLGLHLYGPEGGPPVILTSGDLGWAGLVVHVAESLAGRGYRVLGLSSKDYLTSFTSDASHLTPEQVPGDYAALLDLAARSSALRPILAGVSEGAGLSVLAATGTACHDRVLGVLGLGLPDENEIGWRWRDFTTWITKKSPSEPSFLVSEHIARLAPVPLAAIHSSRDEFVPIAEIRHLIDLALPPRRLWVIDAANHRFSDRREELDRRIVEALEWMRQQAPAATAP